MQKQISSAAAFVVVIMFGNACAPEVEITRNAFQACEEPNAECTDIYDCPNDCNFYVCNFGQCVVTAEKEEGMRCNLECEDAPAFCRAGECTVGCDYALDCPRPPACVSATCSNNECCYSHQIGCTPN